MTDNKAIKINSAYKVVAPTGVLDVDTKNGWVTITLPSLYSTVKPEDGVLVINKVSTDSNKVLLLTEGSDIISGSKKDLDIVGFGDKVKSLELSFDGQSWVIQS